MKKKTFCGSCIAILVSGMLCGCGSQIPDLTEEQRTAISEYAVELLLKYDTNNQSRLVEVEILEKEPETTLTPEPTEAPTEESGMDEVADTPVIEFGEETKSSANIKSVLGLADTISIELVGYQVVDSYGDMAADGFTLDAAAGHKLVINEFLLMNNGSEAETIDMLQTNIKYIMQVAGKEVNCQMTMLGNDLTTYIGKLKADESVKLVLICECLEADLDGNGEIYIEVQREGSKATIPVE